MKASDKPVIKYGIFLEWKTKARTDTDCNFTYHRIRRWKKKKQNGRQQNKKSPNKREARKAYWAADSNTWLMTSSNLSGPFLGTLIISLCGLLTNLDSSSSCSRTVDTLLVSKLAQTWRMCSVALTILFVFPTPSDAVSATTWKQID